MKINRRKAISLINSEGIYATRPWKTFGDGPVVTAPSSTSGTRFNESGRRELTAEEVRFTTKGETIYAFVMGWPEKLAFIRPLATTSKFAAPKIQNVELLGYKGKLKWTQDEQGLEVEMSEQKPCDYAITWKIVEMTGLRLAVPTTPLQGSRRRAG